MAETTAVVDGHDNSHGGPATCRVTFEGDAVTVSIETDRGVTEFVVEDSDDMEDFLTGVAGIATMVRQ